MKTLSILFLFACTSCIPDSPKQFEQRKPLSGTALEFERIDVTGSLFWVVTDGTNRYLFQAHGGAVKLN